MLVEVVEVLLEVLDLMVCFPFVDRGASPKTDALPKSACKELVPEEFQVLCCPYCVECKDSIRLRDVSKCSSINVIS